MKIYSEDDGEIEMGVVVHESDDTYGPHIALMCSECQNIHLRFSFTVDELIGIQDWIKLILASRRN